MPQRILKTVKKTCYTGTLFLLFVGRQSYAGDVLVTVEGIQATATLYGALVNSASGDWAQPPLQVSRSEGETLHFADVPAGEYAIQVFQDLNGNAELDQSQRGVPLEPVGFSGNPSLFNGKPSVAKTRFEHGSADTQVNIRLRQPKKRN